MAASGRISDGQDTDVSRYLNRGGDSWASKINCDSQKQRSDPVYNDLEKRKEKKKGEWRANFVFIVKFQRTRQRDCWPQSQQLATPWPLLVTGSVCDQQTESQYDKKQVICLFSK